MAKNRIKLGGGYGPIKLNGESEIVEKKLSGDNKTNIAICGVQSLTAVIDGILSLVREKENTKRIQIEQNVQIKKLDNELEAVLSQERVEIEKIQKEFELNFKQLENTSELNRLQARIIEKLLDRVGNLELKVETMENKYGFDNPVVITLSNQLHEQNINLTNQLKLQG